MKTAPQAQMRSWARAQGMTVNDRGSLPSSVTEAYAAAHTPSKRGSVVASPTRKPTARKSTARTSTARKATARKATASKAPARKAAPKPPRARKAAPTRRATPAAPRVAAAAPTTNVDVTAPAPGTIDLAGALRSYLGSIDAEVRAVSVLSERIDVLVIELNDLRDQQAKRLIVLDELRTSVSDKSLGSFLDQTIQPRQTRVPEIIPERLL
ncbi:MAG: Lsr2 [Frankiales bacterium]|nr:Lsr2 [Frankiales bacterium]